MTSQEIEVMTMRFMKCVNKVSKIGKVMGESIEMWVFREDCI